MHLQFSTRGSTAATGMNLFSAWLVHLYTATGALAAFFGTLAVFSGNYRAALLWMVGATLVDATDGVLARKAEIGRASCRERV